MYQEYSHLIVYRVFQRTAFCGMCAIIRDFDEKRCGSNDLIDRIHTQIKALLDLSTALASTAAYGCYLTWLLLTNENSFTLSSGAQENGSIQPLVLMICASSATVLLRFPPSAKGLHIDCFDHQPLSRD